MRKPIPSISKIEKWWLDGNGEIYKHHWVNDGCFGCSLRYPVERCHLHSDNYGGSNEPSNIVLLCEYCHFAMDDTFIGLPEDRPNQLAWILLREVNIFDRFRKYMAEKEEIYGATVLYKSFFRGCTSSQDLLSMGYNPDRFKSNTYPLWAWEARTSFILMKYEYDSSILDSIVLPLPLSRKKDI